ncbi:hypothetical protein OG2516_14990 [Oceanicola granulosus HTCC2516]|uniref:Uncharacterized protein n=1 Tax=Oceanicola granulosus (strain ATCC BAA-861 / DSM 15982 / KCTC 12143 / HTCC2516) TaxID=314256 RepID=Q2CER7_OCEGH|nr:hypothetical protein [Oceanicola granulosus]EAR51191.1 hypothetical protein OG2516_14990 [Oceanicola granulosus HTCC2516]
MSGRGPLERAAAGDLVRLGGTDALVLSARHAPGGSLLALLVGDGIAARRARAALRRAGGVEAAVFTPTGSGSASFQLDEPACRAITLAIMPVDLAERLLETARRQGGLPEPERTLLPAYVTAYFRSLPRLAGKADDAPADDPARDAHRAELDRTLAAAGWRPPHDMLERLALADPWIHDRLLPPAPDGPETAPGVTAFFVRARAVELGFLERMREVIADVGFEILASIPLEGALAEEMRKSSRGGNWGAGPFLVSGGPPRHMFIAYDAFPLPPRDATLAEHPLLDNARTLTAKTDTRKLIAAATGAWGSFNSMHSTDHSAEAFRIAAMLMTPDELAALKATVAGRLAAVRRALDGTRLGPGRDITAAGLRADGIVRRVFRPHLAAYAAPVADAQQRLAPRFAEVSDIVAVREGAVDFADPGPGFVPASALAGPLPLALAHRLRELLVAAAREGLVLGRWDPAQALYVSTDLRELRLLGLDRPHPGDSPRSLGDCLADPATRADLVRLTGIPTWAFLDGTPAAMRLSRDVLRPAGARLDRLRRKASNLILAGLKRTRRPS